jgi:hypothetical protein
MSSQHALLWKWRDVAGPNGLQHWQEFTRSGNEPNFRRRYGTGQLGDLAATAASQCVERGNDVTIAWGGDNPATVPYDAIEPTFWKLSPITVFCRERPSGSRWISSDLKSKPEGIPEAAVQSAILDLVEKLYPRRWDRDSKFQPRALLIRPSANGEQLKLIDPEPLTGDRILNQIATDPQVHEAFVREDAAFPLTVYDLAVARLAAQRRIGIPEDRRVVMYSGQVEGLLMNLMMRFGMPGFETHDILTMLRRQFRRDYRELCEDVLMMVLRDYPHSHSGISALREAARATATPATAA